MKTSVEVLRSWRAAAEELASTVGLVMSGMPDDRARERLLEALDKYSKATSPLRAQPQEQ